MISQETAQAVLRVISKHVSESQMHMILKDLLRVPGNESFKDSVRRLLAESAARRLERK